MRIMHGDCLQVLPTLDSESVDSLITDPPAGISLMNLKWDSDKGGRDQWIDWLTQVMAESLRVAKKGSYALVWALPRTSHWTGMALENAGWDIKDKIVHHFTSGFPKNSGLLKPASEDWWVAKKPGIGSLNTQRSLIGDGNRHPANATFSHSDDCVFLRNELRPGRSMNRYLDGPKPFGGGVGHPHESTVMPDELVEIWDCVPECVVTESAQRCFFASKASRSEKEAGLENFEKKYMERDNGFSGKISNTHLPRANTHISVKNIALMRHLVSLSTPFHGRILDPFLGSGSTAIAALLEGHDCLGIEQSQEYIEIAWARIAFWQRNGEKGLEIVAERDRVLRDGDRMRQERIEQGQMDLLSLL